MNFHPDIVRLLRTENLSDRAIALRLGCCAKTVARNRRALGLLPHKPGQPAKTLAELFDERTQPVDGGHRQWTGHRDEKGTPGLRAEGRYYTAYQAAHLIHTGRMPVGNATPQCSFPGCVEPEHVQDRTSRDQSAGELDKLVDMLHQRSYPHNGHRIWTGTRATDGGAPVLTINGHTRRARRIMFEHVHGRPPQGIIRLTCDESLCIVHTDDTAIRQRDHYALRCIQGIPAPPPQCVHGHDRAVHGRYDSSGMAYCVACSRDVTARYRTRRRTTSREETR